MYLSSPRAKRAGSKGLRLRALGLLLADGALTVGWGKTFWVSPRIHLGDPPPPPLPPQNLTKLLRARKGPQT